MTVSEVVEAFREGLLSRPEAHAIIVCLAEREGLVMLSPLARPAAAVEESSNLPSFWTV